MEFSNLGLIENIIKVLAEQDYEEPTPIQVQAIPLLLAGKDILGCAQTGTGKTAAFSLPILQHLSKKSINTNRPRNPLVLVLIPTRELAAQIEESVKVYSKFINIKVRSIIGGVRQGPQELAIKKGIDFLIATPGRLLDLANQRSINLSDIEYLVLDEADRMLDMGFIKDIRKILKFITKKHQTMLFSATMPQEIKELANSILSNPETITITPKIDTANLIKQYLFYVDQGNKKHLLVSILEKNFDSSILIFTRTKHGADKLVKELGTKKIKSLAIHSNKSQNARLIALNDFKTGKVRILIATDIVSRGIDISELPYVINYDVPNEQETYVHRIGRTGRAGSKGVSITFCNEAEVPFIYEIEKLINKEIEVVENHPYMPAFYKSISKLKISSSAAKRNRKNRPSTPNPIAKNNNPQRSNSSNRKYGR